MFLTSTFQLVPPVTKLLVENEPENIRASRCPLDCFIELAADETYVFLQVSLCNWDPVWEYIVDVLVFYV